MDLLNCHWHIGSGNSLEEQGHSTGRFRQDELGHGSLHGHGRIVLFTVVAVGEKYQQLGRPIGSTMTVQIFV